MAQSPDDNEESFLLRERCYVCYRPQNLCFCDEIPTIDNVTPILILQHVVEKTHAFNTARIVAAALERCELVVGHGQEFKDHALPIKPGAGLLFPASDAAPLEQLPVHERPTQLVIIDGTWHQAKTIVRDTPQLAHLPRFQLRPERPGEYRIRREPNAQSLSTVEATAAALELLEPETAGIPALRKAFRRMIDDQLAHNQSRNAWRRRRDHDGPLKGVPHSLRGDPSRIVVVYGEAASSYARQESPETRPGTGHATHRPERVPICWFARRLTSRETREWYFPVDDEVRVQTSVHTRLNPEAFRDAVAPEQFLEEWTQFFDPDRDTLVVFHPNTQRLLQSIFDMAGEHQVNAAERRCIVLKAIIRSRGFRFHVLEEILEQLALEQGFSYVAPLSGPRAEERLRMAQAVVEWLRLPVNG